MLNELIDKIEVYQAEKIDGKKVQQLKIHYNCIGAIEIPDLSKLPENNVSVHTRQGVNVQYAALAVWTQKKNVLIGSSPIRTLGMVRITGFIFTILSLFYCSLKSFKTLLFKPFSALLTYFVIHIKFVQISCKRVKNVYKNHYINAL